MPAQPAIQIPAVRGIGPRKVKNSKVERYSVTGGGTWDTLFNLTDGPAVVTNLWYAQYAFDLTVLRVRITVDGTVVIDNAICDLFLTGNLSSPQGDLNFHFRHNLAGSFVDGDTTGGYLSIPMPYASSFKLEVQNDIANPNDLYFQVERSALNTSAEFLKLGLPNSSMRLYSYGDGAGGNLTDNATYTIFDTGSVPAVLIGMYHCISNANTSGFIEGNYKIFYGGSGTAEYESSGTEDFYKSVFGFAPEGPFAAQGIALASFGSDDNHIIANRFWDIDQAPYDPSGIKMTWQNGEGGLSEGNATNSRWMAFVYK